MISNSKGFKNHIKNYIEEDAEDLYENAPCGYLSFTPNGIIVRVNATLLRWLGWKREDIIYKKKFSELLNIGGRIFYETHFAPLLRIQGFINEINFDLLKKDNSLLPVLLNATEVKDNDGVVVLYRATIFDITDRKKYEQELLQARKRAEQAVKVKSEFISTVSHEIRTPMNAIIGITELLSNANPKPDQIENLQILKSSSEHLLNLINDILDFSKIESGKVKVEERNFNLKALVNSIVFNLQRKATDKGISIRTCWDESLPEFFKADPVKISQILTNLLSNAIKFTEEGYVEVKVKTKSQEHDHIILDFSVRDTGIGISKDRLDKVFEEFVQESYETNLKYGGTGLGLSICQKLLKLHNSQLHVKSKVGQGTKFFFSIKTKLGETIETEEEVATKVNKAVSIRGVRVLLIDDNKINIMIASQFLISWGVKLDTGESGLEAIEMVSDKEYDLVLMDLQMPGMNGYEATSNIRSLGEKYQNLPIIALTATAVEELPNIKSLGFNDLVSKPFNSAHLFSIIAHYGLKSIKTDSDQSFQKSNDTILSNQDTQPAIRLQKYYEITKKKPENLLKMLKHTLDDFQLFQSKYRQMLISRDQTAFKDAAHRLKAVLHYIEAYQLIDTIEKAQFYLSVEADTKFLKDIEEEIEQQLNMVMDMLRDEIHQIA